MSRHLKKALSCIVALGFTIVCASCAFESKYETVTPYKDSELSVTYDLLKDGTSSGRYISEFAVRHIERFEIGTDYVAIVDRIVTLFKNPHFQRNCKLVVDQTGVGRPVMDIMKEKKLKPVGITITGGHDVVNAIDGYRVPKKDIVTALDCTHLLCR